MPITYKKIPIVVTIAGSDSSGGAGIQGDIKTISASGAYAASVITALTAQNTQGVQAVHEIPHAFVQQQMDSVFNDLHVDAVKIGMLHSKNTIHLVSSQLKKFKPKYIVLDPVIIAKSGHALLNIDALSHLIDELGPISTLITPNLPEVAALFDMIINNRKDMESAAKIIGKKIQTNVLVKGGHLISHESSDVLYLHNENKCHWFNAKRIATPHTHGTGCTLSSAIASFLAKGHSINEAVNEAKTYLTKAIQSSRELAIGCGKGPVHHFFQSN